MSEDRKASLRERRRKKERKRLLVLTASGAVLVLATGVLTVLLVLECVKNGDLERRLAALMQPGMPVSAQETESEPASTEAPSEDPGAETEPDHPDDFLDSMVPADAKSLEEDPRFSVTRNYTNIGIINGKVNNYLNIRKEPDVNSLCVGKAFKYSAFDVLSETDNGWYYIETNGKRGYVSADYVSTGTKGIMLAMEKCMNHCVALEDHVPVYKTYDTSSDVVYEAPIGTSYLVLDNLGDWVKITTTSGIIGYAERSKMNVLYILYNPYFYGEGISELRMNIVNYAFEWYGGEYVWGGTTLGEGVDCSGYTMRVFEKFGINIPRLSIEQSKWGTKVNSIEEALPGDLLFYHALRNGVYSEDVGHVAIYIGDGMMIHAASEERGIVVDYYRYLEEPLGIRRVIND